VSAANIPTDKLFTSAPGRIYEKRPDGTYAKHYSAFGRHIAMRDNTRVYYVVADHLGSSTVVTEGGGAVAGMMMYYPYGAMRATTGSTLTDKLFTCAGGGWASGPGHQREPEMLSSQPA